MKYLLKTASIVLFGVFNMTNACWIGDYSMETRESNSPGLIVDFGRECPGEEFYSLTSHELVGAILRLLKMKDINLTLRNFTNKDARIYVFPILEGMIQDIEDYVRIPKVAVQPPLNQQSASQTQIFTQSFSQEELASPLEEILEELKNARVECLAKKEVEEAIAKADASQKTPTKGRKRAFSNAEVPRTTQLSQLLGEVDEAFVTAAPPQFKRARHEDKGSSPSIQPSGRKLMAPKKSSSPIGQPSTEKPKVKLDLEKDEDYAPTPPLIPPPSHQERGGQQRETFSQYVRQFQYPGQQRR